MIQQLSTTTYSRYPHHGETITLVPKDASVPKETGGAAEVEAALARPKRALTKKEERQSREHLWRKEMAHQLSDMVARLNMKQPLFQSPIQFQLEETARAPRILMLGMPERQVLNHYDNNDLIELERGLYDMAGFQLNFEI